MCLSPLVGVYPNPEQRRKYMEKFLTSILTIQLIEKTFLVCQELPLTPSCHCHLQSLYCQYTRVFRNQDENAWRNQRKSNFPSSSSDFSTKYFILCKDSVMSTEDCTECISCAWAPGQGSDCPITLDKFNFTSTKKDCCAFTAHQFWQRSVQISPNSSAHYQQWFYITNIWVFTEKPK